MSPLLLESSRGLVGAGIVGTGCSLIGLAVAVNYEIYGWPIVAMPAVIGFIAGYMIERTVYPKQPPRAGG